MTDNQQDLAHAEQAGVVGHYNPVAVTDTLGTIFLGTIVFILLIALLRAQARNRELLARLSRE